MNRWAHLAFDQKRTDAVLVAGASILAIVAVFHPADSVDVERGEAVGWCIGVMLWVAALFCLRCDAPANHDRKSLFIDAFALSLAGWIMLSAWWNSGNAWLGGDFRLSTNEAWLWIAVAAWFVGVRRLSARPAVAEALLALTFFASVVLAGHALHQHFVSMPQTLRDYESNPDRALQSLGLDAPAGSATRMIFESRLRDGGPTATFALANSLAGPLSMGLAMMLAMFTSKVGNGSPWQPRLRQVLSPMVFFTILATAMFFARSRGAIGSLMIVSCTMLIGIVARHFNKQQTAGRWAKLCSAIVLVSLCVVGLWLLGRGREWIDSAPASIAFRLQYWKSSLAMAVDYPVLGIGPGNFQLVYPVYRDITAHETIAEPHNFWFETLAAGGFVGAGLLTIFLGLAVSGAKWSFNSSTTLTEPHANRTEVWIGLGLGLWLGLTVVMLLGLFSGKVPDLDAAFVSLPIAVTALFWWFFSGLRRCDVRWLALVAASCGLLHLTFSGGWTIPGVVWMLTTLGSVALVPATTQGSCERRPYLGLAWVGMTLLCVFISWLPNFQTNQRIQSAASQFARGQVKSAQRTLEAVLQDEPHASDALMWLLQSKVKDGDFADLVKRYEGSIGNDATRFFIVANLFVHRYQIAGQRADLIASWNWIAQALVRNPTHEAMMAQAAEIRRELGASTSVSWPEGAPSISLEQLPNPADANQLAEQAARLADAGGVVTRTLGLQLILPARVIGNESLDSPLRKSAADLLDQLPAN